MKVRNKHNREMIVDLGEQWEPESSGIEEVWRDVTEECKVSPLAGSELHLGGFKIYLPMGYRFRKVFRDRQGWSIIVEQKVQP